MSVLEDAMDLVAFIFFLGIALAISFGIVVPVMHEDDNFNTVAVEDKTAPTLKGISQEIKNTNEMNTFEAILSTQVQDTNMPKPKKYTAVATPESGATNYEVDIEKVGVYYGIDSKLTEFANGVFNVFNQNMSVNANTKNKEEAFYTSLSCDGGSDCTSELHNLDQLKDNSGESFRIKLAHWRDFISKCNGTYYDADGNKVEYACTERDVPYSGTDSNPLHIYKKYNQLYVIGYMNNGTRRVSDDSYTYEVAPTH